MDLMILKDVNDLWSEVYPYLAAHAMAHYGRSHGNVLELGPFAGGISVELAKLYPGLKITIAAQGSVVADLLRRAIEEADLGRRIELRCCALDELVFSDSAFDLVIFRGAYFFLEENGRVIREVYRVLKDNGVAFIGGGYGKDTPKALIDGIAERSRDLNDRLGRKRVTVDGVKAMVGKAGLTEHTSIEYEGGLWLVVRK